ncbi:hypothetical protein [Streptomyces sp. NPDC058667]|uniref:hypothetical protein n=1 Tax=Streptomyces sp. NPDC058667 TaxID=3346588 RepID=UPI0036527758
MVFVLEEVVAVLEVSRRDTSCFVAAFVDDLRTGHGHFRAGFRRGVRSVPGVYELTWAPDGRATWSYGRARMARDRARRRIGIYDILARP